MKKIMIIDDDRDIQTLMKIFLELEGHQISIPFEFGAVPSLLIEDRPEILILDVNLSGYNGIEILEELRKDVQFDEIKVILTSGLDYSHKIEDFSRCDFILKPYMPDELISKIKKI